MRGFGGWIEERMGLRSAWRAFMDHPVPGGASWFHALGAMAAFLVALECLTGLFLAFFYAPSASTAWASVAYIQDQVTLGWLVRGLHSFGSSALVAVTGLHLLGVLVWGAYRAPREANWIVGLGLLALVLLFAITGYALPWDQKGYWAKLVETSILGTTPVLGPALERIAQGGGGFGNFTVTHFFAVHVLVLPAALGALLWLHLAMVRRHRVTPRWGLRDDEVQRRTESYWPGQAFRDTAASTVALAVVVAFVLARRGAALEGPADPAATYMARPEWYALPLYQLRLLFEGPLEIVATMIIPALVAGFLVAVPFLDRAPSRSPVARVPILAVIAVIGLGAGGLAALALSQDARDPGFQRHRRQVEQEADRARSLAQRGVLPAGGLAVFENDPDHEVRRLFKEKCKTCHLNTGEGGGEGPDLLDYNSRAWLLAFLRDPQGSRFMGGAGKPERGQMKPVEGPADELFALTEYVYAFSGAADVDRALAEQGAALFEARNCDSCHETDGVGEARGPNLKDRGTVGYTRRIIEDASAPALYGDRAKMPRFKADGAGGPSGKLTPEQIERLARFVLSLKRG